MSTKFSIFFHTKNTISCTHIKYEEKVLMKWEECVYNGKELCKTWRDDVFISLLYYLPAQ